MLDNIKTLLGLTDESKDKLLIVLLDQAKEDAKLITNNEDIENVAKSTIERMVVYNYNRLGAEGLKSESYSGVSYSYDTDYPENIVRQLRAHRKLRVL